MLAIDVVEAAYSIVVNRHELLSSDHNRT